MLIYLALIDTESDKRKFELIYNQYKQLMFYVAKNILYDIHESEDAVHQAFLRVIDHFEKIEEVDCPQTRAYLVIIVKNISLNILKKRKNNNLLSYDELDPFIQCYGDDKPLGLMEAIFKLPTIFSNVLILKYSNGYTTQEISEILDINYETVKKRITRAKQALSEVLNNDE